MQNLPFGHDTFTAETGAGRATAITRDEPVIRTTTHLVKTWKNRMAYKIIIVSAVYKCYGALERVDKRSKVPWKVGSK